MSEANPRVRWVWLPPAAACAVVLVAGIVLSHGKTVWLDEAYTMETVSGDLAKAFRRALQFELQPPLYYVMLRLWLVAGPSVHLARLFSTLCASLAVLVLYDATRHLAPNGVARWRLLALAVVSAPLLWAATEARTYALAILLNAGSINCFVRRWMSGDRSPWWQLPAWAAVSYAAMLTHYYSGFMLLGQGIVGLTSSRGRSSMIAGASMLALAMVPWLPVTLHQVALHPAAPAPVADAMGRILARGLLLPAFRSPILDRALFVAVATVVVLGLAAGCLLAGSDERRSLRSVWILVAAPITSLLILQATGATSVEERHWMVVTPAALLVLAIAPDCLRRVAAARVAFLVLLLLSAASAVSMARNLSPTDYEGAGRFLARHVSSDEPVLVFPPQAVLAMKYAYPYPGRLRGLPQDASFERFPYPDSVRYIREPCTVIRRLASLTLERTRVWLVTRPYETLEVLDSALAGLSQVRTQLSEISVIEVEFTAASRDSLLRRFCSSAGDSQ